MLRDLKRFNYLLTDDNNNKMFICSKYIFRKDEIKEFIDEAKECYCADIESIADHLIRNHEFESFNVETEYNIDVD